MREFDFTVTPEESAAFNRRKWREKNPWHVRLWWKTRDHIYRWTGC